MIEFFCVQKKGWNDMLNIINQKLNLSPELRKKINWAKNYSNIDITIEKGSLIRLEPTNIAYVEPHKVIINENEFLFFNGNDNFYINDLNKSYKLNELHNYFTKLK
jgi:hypothetical protein